MLHAFTDGRDTLPDSGAGYVAEVEALARGGRRPRGERDRAATTRWTATAAGTARSWRWTRSCAGEAEGRHAATGEEAVRAAYERGETDEFVKPTLVGEKARIEAGDVVIFFNFRPDRARQLTQALNTELDLHYTTLTRVPGGLGLPGGLPARAPRHHAGLGARDARPRPAARGRDREVRRT